MYGTPEMHLDVRKDLTDRQVELSDARHDR